MKSNYDVANKVHDLFSMMRSFKESAANPLQILENGSDKFEHPGDDISDLLKFGNLNEQQLSDLHSDLSKFRGDIKYQDLENDSTISVSNLKNELPQIQSAAAEILGNDNGHSWARQQGEKLTQDLTKNFLPIITKAYNFATNLAS